MLNSKAMNKKKSNITSIEISDEAKRPAKGIYVLPNLFTSAGLFAGFYAIMQARLGHFEAACLAIYVAMIMDILDGRLARLTNTMSDFGSEYDSLSDMVSFGVAPALILYDFVLSDLGRLGSLITFLYIACAALRLARFNIQKLDDKRYFIGLPSPGAAAMLVSLVWVFVDYNIAQNEFTIVFGVLIVMLAFSMVSNIKYRSFKDVDFRDKMPFIGLILVIGGIYLISGTVSYTVKLFKKKSPLNIE